MVKLNYELTERLLNVDSEDALKQMHQEGVNFAECSRVSIDEVLQKVYKKKCNSTKDKAVEMLIALINGQEVEDILETPTGVHHEDNSPASQMDPVLRMQKIKERMEVLVTNMPNYYEYSKKLIRDPEMKMLGATEEDLKEVSKESEVSICGQGWKSHKYYLMKKTPENIKIAQGEGDILYYAPGDPLFAEVKA